MIKYWSGERYQELDKGACDLNHTHQSRYLDITTDVLQVELQIRYSDVHYGNFVFEPTFIRRKVAKGREEDLPNDASEGPFLGVCLDDETKFDESLPIVCATMTSLNIVDSWRSFGDRQPTFLLFQKKAKFYERIGACSLPAYAIDMTGRRIHGSDESRELVPPGEPGAWDQVAERRTFLLG